MGPGWWIQFIVAMMVHTQPMPVKQNDMIFKELALLAHMLRAPRMSQLPARPQWVRHMLPVPTDRLTLLQLLPLLKIAAVGEVVEQQTWSW
jgi:hypothetical protein